MAELSSQNIINEFKWLKSKSSNFEGSVISVTLFQGAGKV